MTQAETTHFLEMKLRSLSMVDGCYEKTAHFL